MLSKVWKISPKKEKQIKRNNNKNNIKTTTHSFMGIYNSRPKPNIDASKSLFNHCLLHSISLRGLGVNTNTKTALKIALEHNVINDYPMEPP